MTQEKANGIPNFSSEPRRYYMAGLGTFLTQVREAEWVGGEHPYGYAMNNPVTYADPSGLDPCPPIVSTIRDNLSVQLMVLSWKKENVHKVNQCIQDAAKSKGIKCDPFRSSTANCLRDNFPLVECRCDCRAGLFGYAPGKPQSLIEIGRGKVYKITICFNNMNLVGVANYLPGLGDSSSEVIWITLLHEALHACAFHHGTDSTGGEPHPSKTCNEIAVCCIHSVISGKPTKACKTHLP